MSRGEAVLAGKTAMRWLWIGRAVLLVWMLGVVLPYVLSAHEHVDFPQLYMAGTIAVEGQWDALYATPLPDAELNPAYPTASTAHPEYLRLAEERGVPPESLRYIYPPPAALLCWPLGLVDYATAVIGAAILSCLTIWLVGIQAGLVYRHFAGRPSRVELVLGVLACICPAMINGTRALNIAMVSAALIGLAVLSLLRPLHLHAPWSLALGGIFKATSGPLVVVATALGRWRAMVGTIVVSIAIVAASLLIMGVGPFERFFADIAPNLMTTTPEVSNQSLVAVLVRQGLIESNGNALDWIRRVGIVLLLGIAVITRLQTRRNPEQKEALLMAGMYLAMLTWMVFNPLFWSHYQMILAPFWGWLAWEVYREAKAGRWAWVVAIGLCFASVWFPITIVLNQKFATPEIITSHVLWATLVLAGFTAWRLFKPLPESSKSVIDNTPPTDHATAA